MNVLYIVSSTRVVGGASKSFLTLLYGMAEKGVTPYVVTPDKGDMYAILREKGFSVTDVNLRPSVYPNLRTLKDALLFLPRLIGRRLLERKASRRILDICAEKKIDLIHANLSLLSCGIHASKKLHIPHVWHVREYVDKDFDFHYYPTKRAYYRTLNAKNAYTICITRGVQEHHHFVGKNARVVYNGIDMQANAEHCEFPKDSFFLFAGRIEPAKNPMQVVEAFHLFCQRHPENNMTLKLAGPVSDPSYWANIKDVISRHRLDDRVQYLGIRKDIGNLMNDARAIIVSSDFEAFGRCLPEAMLSNCLTIGKDFGGTKEQYDNGVTTCGEEIGLRYKTTEELADRMSELWPDIPARFDAMKKHASTVVKELYSKESYVNSIYSFYQEILQHKP
ncbi:MAG: glycosyltransferase family 4 protein [Bacteroidaceae bacterium]|nr:glycosyltransferase family 4 protein [Bacteroidaceae bacterium]